MATGVGGRSRAGVLADPGVGEVLAESRLVYTAVRTRSGPHVTPQAFAVFAGRIWLITPRGSLKARMVRVDGAVGALVRHGKQSVVLGGVAEVISPWGFGDAARLARNALPAQGALATYATRNAPLLAGYLRDLLSLPAGGLPYDRALISIRPQRAVLLEGDAVVRRWGRWPRPRESAGTDGNVAAVRSARTLLRRVPAEAAEAAQRRGPCVVGWHTDAGPLALPGTWNPDTELFTVSAELATAARLASTARACVTVDHSGGIRPTRFCGVMLRGQARSTATRRRLLSASIAVERVTWWMGFAAGTITAAPTRVSARGSRKASA